MCYACYEEYEGDYGCTITPAAIAASDLISAVYEVHAAGGYAHIVVDDWNLGDDSIDFCLNETDIDDVCHECLVAMKELPMPERIAALALYDQFVDLPELP